MTDYGVITKKTIPSAFYTSITYTETFGIAQVGIDNKFSFHNKIGIVKPVLGQMWPRPVWQYNDNLTPPSSTLGIVYKFHFYNYGVVYPPILVGQLWPRGDYVANGIYNG